MTTTLSTSARPATAADLIVRREDIEFADVAPGLVRIAIRVINEGDRRSAPTAARVEAAPLGVFVPWRHLTTIPVPPLEPGESTVLEAEARRPKVAPLGPPDRLPPRRLLTALASGDDRSDRRGMASSLLRGFRLTPDGPSDEATPTLPADLFELMGHSNPHWAGNLNVFIGSEAVERHMARALRIEPGRVNVAMFMVGSRPDVYSFRMEGAGSDWEAAIYLTDYARSLSDRRPEDRVALGPWVEVDGPTMLMLAIAPPVGAEAGGVDIHVRQRSTGREAVVEFSLDPRAAGPGCYVVP